MSKKFVATIMNRTYMGDKTFIYLVSHPEIGEIDQRTGIFKDRNGKEYAPINDTMLMMSEVDDGYYNLVELDKIQDMMGTSSVKEAISDLNYYASRIIYVVTQTEEGIPIVLTNNIDVMRNEIEEAIKKGATQELIGSLDEPSEDNYSLDETDEENEHIDLDDVIINMINGEYSIDELKLLKKKLEEEKEDYEGVIDSLNLQIEATEKGESSTILKEALKSGKVKKLEEEDQVEEEPTKDIAKMNEKIKNYIDINKIFALVTETLIAQDEPTRRVITEIARKEQSPSLKNRALLITGATGVGKTKMMELISKYLDRPFHKIDSTKLTIPGFVGTDIEEELWQLYLKSGQDKEKAEHAIVFFDEIDKKGSGRKDDVSGQGVLNVLLTFIEGSKYLACEDTKKTSNGVELDSKNMIVILGGAYTDVYNDKFNKAAIGFGKKEEKQQEVKTEDFVEKAMMPNELMGRVSIIKLNDLDVESIKRILLESNESAIKIQKRIFEELGVKLTFDEEFITEIASKAIERKTGARGINNIVDEITWEAYGDAYTNLGTYDEIIINKETIEDPKVYKKVYKNKKTDY